jgi:NitT/TauT family transport system permease protein
MPDRSKGTSPNPQDSMEGRGAWRLRLISLTGVVLTLLAWEAATKVFSIPRFVLPAPTDIALALAIGFIDGPFFRHTTVTLLEIGAGFAIGAVIGITLGSLISQFQVVEALLYPYIVALNSLPKIAVAPLVLLWLGFGIVSTLALAAFVSFFPLLVNVIVGLRASELDEIRLMQSFNASRWQIFRMVQIPNALPYFFAGLEIAIVFAVVGAIVGEFVGSREGLGYFILLSQSLLDTSGMFAAFVVLALIGAVLSFTVQRIARRVVFWKGLERASR